MSTIRIGKDIGAYLNSLRCNFQGKAIGSAIHKERWSVDHERAMLAKGVAFYQGKPFSYRPFADFGPEVRAGADAFKALTAANRALIAHIGA